MKLSGYIILLLALFAFSDERNDVYQVVKNNSFARGEVLYYKMSYGFLNIGKGTVRIHENFFQVNDRQCYKLDIYGKTVGVVDWVADVDDQWGAYIDTAALVPHISYRKIREGKYRKDEIVNYDHANQKIEVKHINQKTGKYKEPKYFEYDKPAQMRDMIGGLLYLRTIDLSNVKPGDSVSVNGFMEDEFYKMNIVYKGKSTIKTKVGKVKCLVFVPVMPNNKIFDGENSITVWFSDDKNRIPIKVSAKMFIGSAGVELTSYGALRNPLNIIN